MEVRQISSVQVSPDGKRVAYAVREAVIEKEKSEYVTHIYLANSDGSDLVQLTWGETSSYNPRWSPDGEWIAFTSRRSGKQNVWLIRVRGGEARMLTDVETGVSSFKWSPDGKWIAFTAPDPPSPQEEQAAREKDDARVMGENIKMTHLYLIPIEKDAAGKREARQLTTGNYNVGLAVYAGEYDWSPDSKTIAFTHTRAPRPDDWMSAGISLLDVESATVRPLVNTEVAELSPFFSPDGQWIAYKAAGTPPWGWNFTVHLIPASGGTARKLAQTFDERTNHFGWSPDGKRLYYTESHGTTVGLYALPVTGTPEEISAQQGVISVTNLNQTRSMLGFVFENAHKPPEAYVSRLDNFAPVQISQVNQDKARLPLGRTVVTRWKSVDGVEIEGLLTYPVDYASDKRYPLLLSVHGGPASVFSQTFIGSPSVYGPLAALSSRGYAVLRCNVRGSTGYGKEFRHANYQDWGGMDFQDLMAGVDHVINLGVADAERLGVMGWSYGGFLTASAITQTRRFRAAVVGAGITNLISNAGTADIPNDIPNYFGGEPWEKFNLLRARSPVLNVKGVDTPTLILHGERDKRVPVTQGYELYNALKRQGCVVKMVVYPRTPHVPQEPKLFRDVLSRCLEWFDDYVPGTI
jgi:dipeptidyl aminopeptidase/acylaminoacyl peptidase